MLLTNWQQLGENLNRLDNKLIYDCYKRVDLNNPPLFTSILILTDLESNTTTHVYHIELIVKLLGDILSPCPFQNFLWAIQYLLTCS